MKISPSLYSFDSRNIAELARELDKFHVDYFHIDCKDDPRVFDDIARIREASRTPIDLHLIAERPEDYFDRIIEHQVELVAFQYENLVQPLEIPDGFPARCGLAITPETDPAVFAEVADRCSFVLFMTTTPGVSGGTFDGGTFRRIREFRRIFPHAVHVDGGVNRDIAFVLRTLGVSCTISGSYLASSAGLGSAVLSLHSDLDTRRSCRVRDFMMGLNELPVLSEREMTLETVLGAMERSRLGFVLVVREDRHLVGVVTNGDVRRALMRSLRDPTHLLAETLVNRNPVTVSEEQSLDEMLEVVRAHDRSILFLPVVDAERRLVGGSSFQDLVKGEA